MTSTMAGDAEPRAVYVDGAESYGKSAEGWRRLERRLSHGRLAVFLAGIAIGWLAFGSHVIPSVWMLPPVVLFVALIILHDRVIRRLKVAERTADFFESGLARLNESWHGTGHSGEDHIDPAHP